jgi:hypothetical protein
MSDDDRIGHFVTVSFVVDGGRTTTLELRDLVRWHVMMFSTVQYYSRSILLSVESLRNNKYTVRISHTSQSTSNTELLFSSVVCSLLCRLFFVAFRWSTCAALPVADVVLVTLVALHRSCRITLF